MKRMLGFVLQDDIFLNLTVYQQLLFTGLLRFPGSMSHEEKLKRMDSVIHKLGLDLIRDSPIKVVSGGERKRVNIGSGRFLLTLFLNWKSLCMGFAY